MPIYKSVCCELLLFADDACLIIQHKDITETETALNKNIQYALLLVYR